MKLLRLLLVVMFVMGVTNLAIARDAEEVVETVFETITGENSSCPMLYEIGVAKIWEEPFGKKFNLRIELDYQCEIDNLTENNQGKLRTIFEF